MLVQGEMLAQRTTETQTLVPTDPLRRDPLSPCQTPGGAQSQGALAMCAGSVWESGPTLPELPPHLPTQSSSHLCAVSRGIPSRVLTGPAAWPAELAAPRLGASEPEAGRAAGQARLLTVRTLHFPLCFLSTDNRKNNWSPMPLQPRPKPSRLCKGRCL